ncbi:MAG: hypothetical protein AB7G21_10010 [Dehalococcoidia bacterium]
MPAQALPTLLQYGAVGAIAVLAIVALAYVTKRYINRLEASEERHLQALSDISSAIAANGAACSALRDDVHVEAQTARERHREVLGEFRGLASR